MVRRASQAGIVISKLGQRDCFKSGEMLPVYVDYVGCIHDRVGNIVEHPPCVEFWDHQVVVTVHKLQYYSESVTNEDTYPEEL